ncbi:putative TonB-dependent receptor [Caenibius tardaugens NBRC 16725]|uniref:Putative TonB-dependent receptor n=1 Tax=Caenibius tardaugens NBRC 16725 TaxID=1219035 RepID=U2YNB1_9SPHN|nr:TonB-dependent receptor [Caenibius tardaugens]GAD50037.1 putative TonB-dependent receptor [Caenibius tardaugens NBRC 16725]
MHPQRYCYSSAIALAALMASPAMAQEASEPVSSGGGLQEIVVTAQKRAESLQDVPISVSAVSGAMVDSLHATSLKDLQGTVPNIQINNFTNTPNSAVFTIRGIGVIEPDPFAGNTVSIVQDGVPQYFSMGALLDLFDVDRVEVLRGPQGTLFGANTTGGVVNVSTAQPTGEFGGKAEVTIGNYDRIDVKAAIDVPVVEDVLAAKVAVMHSSRDGFYTNIVDGSDMGSRNVTAVRGYLKYTPTSDLNITLSGEYGRARNGAPVVVNGSVPGDLLYAAPGTVYPGQKLPMYQSPCRSTTAPCKAPNKYYSANSSVPDIGNMDTYRATLTIDWDNTGIGDLTAITGYKHFDLLEYTDNDATANPAFQLDTYRHTKGWQLSQELRTSVDLNDSINVLLGGFYLKTHYDHFASLILEFASPGFSQVNTQKQDNWSGSLFAQTFIDVSDKLRLQGGIRYTHEETEMLAGTENFLNPDGPGQFFGSPSIGGFDVKRKKSWDKLGWKLGFDYKASDDLLLYGYYARGFKSGGFVGRISQPQDIGPYGPETVDTFEAGLKADWFDRRLRTNLSLFYTIYKDMQVTQNYILDGDGPTQIGTSIFNAAQSTIKGFELEVTALPVDGLTLNGTLAYLDAKYDKFLFFNSLTGDYDDLKGYRLQNSPKWAATLGATYEFALFGGTATMGAGYSYTASKFLQGLTNTPIVHIQPTHLVRANIGWKPENERWSIELWGNNLFDKRYVEAATWNTGLFSQVAYKAPREYGLSFRFNW